MLIITGLGRTGTSFIARCFHDCGFDMGGQWFDDKNAGMELFKVVKLNRKIEGGVLSGKVCQDKIKEIFERHPIVKDPRFVFDKSHGRVINEWTKALKPKNIRVMLTTRNISEVSMSRKLMIDSKDVGAYMEGALCVMLASFINNLSAHNIVFETLNFPDFLYYDFNVIRKKFKRIGFDLPIGFEDVWERNKDFSKIHHGG